jgi:hypothetical protein
VAKFSLRRHEDQATVSVILSMLALFGLIPLALVVFRNVNFEQRWIIYNPKTARVMVVLVGAAFSGGLAFLGFVLGINSAGQRRNSRQAFSWLGFAVGAAVMLAAFLMLACFWFLKRPMPT